MKSGKENNVVLKKGPGTSNMQRNKPDNQLPTEEKKRLKRVLQPKDENCGDYKNGEEVKKPRTRSGEPTADSDSNDESENHSDEEEPVTQAIQVQGSVSNDQSESNCYEEQQVTEEIQMQVSASNGENGNDRDEKEQVIGESTMQVENLCTGGNLNRTKEAVIVYVQRVMENSPQPDNEVDVKGNFSELVEVKISADVSGIVLKVNGMRDISLKSGKYYALENFGNFNLKFGNEEDIRCMLIGPETRVSVMSARMAEKRNPGLKGQLRDHQEDEDTLLDSLPRTITLANFSYKVHDTINLLKGESVFYMKAFVTSSKPQPRKKTFPGWLLKVIDDKSGRFLNVLIPEEFKFETGETPSAEDTIILQKFVAHKSQKFDTSMILATKHSQVEVLKNDNLFQDLKGHTTDNSSPEFVVLAAGYVPHYDACPKKQCFVKKVKYAGDGQYECPKCQGKHGKVDLKIGRQLDLVVESEDDTELKVSVFNKDIDDLMKELNCKEECDLPEILIDIHIQPSNISPGRGNLPDVLKNIKILS